jgi:hypothetical protein
MMMEVALASEMGIPHTAQKSGDPVSEAYKTMAQKVVQLV